MGAISFVIVLFYWNSCIKAKIAGSRIDPTMASWAIRPEASGAANKLKEPPSFGEKRCQIADMTLPIPKPILSEAGRMRANPTAAGIGIHQKRLTSLPCASRFRTASSCSEIMPINKAMIDAINAPRGR